MKQINPDTSITINNNIIYGVQINQHTGCLHYGTLFDVVAIKFKCCECYYACYSCHLALANHPVERWHPHEFHIKAILCGRCGIEMTILQYLVCNNICLNCKALFNPNCQLHWKFYFAL